VWQSEADRDTLTTPGSNMGPKTLSLCLVIRSNSHTDKAYEALGEPEVFLAERSATGADDPGLDG
jgi:hypothetical protein